MLAVIKTGGKQYIVRKGDELNVEKLDIEEGKEVTFDNVLLTEKNKQVKVGEPTVKGVKVKGKVLEHGKGEKLIVFKYKPKKRQKKKKGHRQPYTRIKIENIES